MNDKHAYRVFPDYDGNWYIDNIEKGSYQIIIKSKEYFQDDDGTFSYMLIKSFEVKDNTINAMGVLHPIRMYLDEQDTQNAIQDVSSVNNEEAPTPNKGVHTTADLE